MFSGISLTRTVTEHDEMKLHANTESRWNVPAAEVPEQTQQSARMDAERLDVSGVILRLGIRD